MGNGIRILSSFILLQNNIVAHKNTMSYLTNMYQNIRKEDQGGFSKSRKPSTKLKGKSEKTPVQSIELKDDDMDIDEKIHEDNPYGNLCVNDKTISKFDITSFQKVIEEKLKNEDDGFKKEYAVRIKRVSIKIV